MNDSALLTQLKKDLQSKDDTTVRQALRACDKLYSPELIPVLKKLREHHSDGVRYLAKKALDNLRKKKKSIIEDRESGTIMLKNLLLSDDIDNILEGLRILVRKKHAPHELHSILKHHLKNTQTPEVFQLLLRIFHKNHIPGAESTLARLHTEDHFGLQDEILLSFYNNPCPDSVNIVTSSMRSEKDSGQTVYSIISYWKKRFGKELIRKLASGSKKNREDAIYLIAIWNEPDSFSMLYDMLEIESSPELKKKIQFLINKNKGL